MVLGELTEVRDRIQRAKDAASALSEESFRLISQAHSLREECDRARGRRPPLDVGRAAERPAVAVDVPQSVHQLALGETEAPIYGPSDPQLRLRTFHMQGRIGGDLVTAHFEAGVLGCDPLLRTHAELVVAMGDAFSFGDEDHALPASLDGPPVIVLLTLMRASAVIKVDAAV